MDDGGLSARLIVHDALRGRGFTRDITERGRTVYKGVLDLNHIRVPVGIAVLDFDFVEAPLIWIDPAYPILDRKLPHVLGACHVVCYYARGSVVLDRYDPGGTVLQCLEQAERVVRDALRGRFNLDFATEFATYWGSADALIDLPRGHVGRATINILRIGPEGERLAVLSARKSWLLDHGEVLKPYLVTGMPAEVVRVAEPLTLNPEGPWPPNTLSELNQWLAWAAPEAVGRLEDLFRATTGPVACIAIDAPNGMFLFWSELPTRFQKDEFLTNRRAGMGDFLRRISSELSIERFTGARADTETIFGRNMGTRQNLTGKRILLVGCGTIGSFLAHQLAQCGAGADEGYLSLVDDDTLQAANLGRHLLGVPYLNKNKAVGCAHFLRQQLPALAIEPHAGDVLQLDIPWYRYDLVIDATGEEALSLALNERAVRRRPNGPHHLFVWLIGNGAAAQGILTGDADLACLKCLKPELASEPRFRLLKPDANVATIANVSCGDAVYTPFPVSRSVAAAALACDLVLDWASDDAGPRHRSITFDGRQAFRLRDGSPAPSSRCPACGGRK